MKPLLIILASLCFCTLNAQYDVPKFGKIDKTELEMTRYESDTSAYALMIFDDGFSEFKISREGSFQFVYNRHYKLKILKQSGLDLANIEIRLYKNNTRKETLSDLRAMIFNLENGNIVKTKFGEKDVLEASSKNYVDYTCALPEVKVGSVIEVYYQIISDFLYDFRGWQFQYKYPALLSQYRYIIPEYFDYRKSSRGYLQFDKNQTSDTFAAFTIQSEFEIEHPMDGKTSSSSKTLRTPAKSSILAIRNVPSFIPEPNLDSENNYIQSIEFELSSVEYPEERRRDYTASWESVNTQMMESEDFGALLKNNGFIKDQVMSICKNATSDIEKAIIIYDHVKNRMKWDEKYSLWASKGLKKPYDEQVGNSSEINLLLTLMLKTAGLTADPVIISTRDNGIANSLFPTITKYNSVISVVTLNNKKILLDATSKFCPFGIIPSNDINGKGRVVNNISGDWIDILPSDKYNISRKYILNISSDGEFDGNVSEIYEGYAGVSIRNKIAAEKTTDDYIRKQQEVRPGLDITSYSFTNTADIYKPLYDSLNIHLSNNSEIVSNKIMFRPLLIDALIKNYYTLEERAYPVNYNFPYSENYTFEYSIPEGYTIEYIPQKASLKLMENSIKMDISYTAADRKIYISYSFEISKMIFLPSEYKLLKGFYDDVVKSHSERIILKKI